MKKIWQPEELVEHWTLLADELELSVNKNEPNRLGFALLLKFFQYYARFPENSQEIPTAVVNYVAKVIDVSPEKYREYDWQGRLIKYHRAQIRKFFGFREATVLDAEELTDWLASQALIYELKFEHLREAAVSKLRELKIEPPTPERLERIIRSAIRLEEERFFSAISSQLLQETKTGIDKLLRVKTTQVTTENNESQTNSTFEEVSSLSELKSDPGRIGVESFLNEINKLETLRSLELPLDLFKKISTKILQIYKQRVIAEQPWDLRRHPEAIRYTIVSAFSYLRSLEVTDNLVELVIQIVHRIGARAERRVDKELLNDFKKVTGKNQILFQIASASINQPSGVIKDVIFPVVGEETLKNLVKEYKSTGNAYREKVYTVMRSSYGGHYRRILPLILSQLEFRSNNEIHRPVIQAIELLKKYASSKQRYYDVGEDIPIEGILRSGWQELILEQSDDEEVKVNRINYELSVLQALRDKLRCKEIWVVGANRYRNPEEDLPTDFEAQRQVYFQALKQPNDVELFISNLQQQMRDALVMLDEGLPKNKSVEIRQRKNKKSWIKVSPLLAEPEPINLVRLKAEITHRWPTTSLLDILKETDLRVGFSEHFKSASQREILDRSVLQKRLLLCLYGLGTNTGLKRLSSTISGEHYHDLLYVKRRFIQKEQLRNAIASVANAIFQARLSSIWGEGTTACASDSKKFGAWDQNLMTHCPLKIWAGFVLLICRRSRVLVLIKPAQIFHVLDPVTEWHIRYGGRGVMIYWHVEKNSVCIYSQLKTCSSSEVAAMIEGLLRHCTEMKVEKNYVDTHGQSVVAFAFCHLLGFQLMPRLKGIDKQKLYRPDDRLSDVYPNLQPVLTRSINWDLIRQQYDQMIKYATALRLGTAETEAILKRFTKGNLMHPTYQALCELGKAIKTIFLCQYLHSVELRREINSGLNIVENWNSANSFIFYGKGGEIATNRLEDQELAVLALHLLQISLVYINTLMIQQVLKEPEWIKLMKPLDLRALSPLIWSHVNPYGTFKLDMDERLPIEAVVA